MLLSRPEQAYPFYEEPAWYRVKSEKCRGPPLTSIQKPGTTQNATNENLAWCPPGFETWFHASTPESTGYADCRPLGLQRFAFDVQAAHSVHLALAVDKMGDDGTGQKPKRSPKRGSPERSMSPISQAAGRPQGDMYEIVIAPKNNASRILRCGTEVASTLVADGRRELSGTGWRGFWVDLNASWVRVGRRGEQEAFMQWEDPEPLAPAYIAFYTGPGSGGGPWRFYCPRGHSQAPGGTASVFSYQIQAAPVVGEPLTITITGANLPETGDRLKVIAGPGWLNHAPAAGSRVARALTGTSSARTGTVTFLEAPKSELTVAYDAGHGYELVRPDHANLHLLLVRAVVPPVAQPSQRLLRPIHHVPSSPAKAPPSTPKIVTEAAREKIIERLYDKELEHQKLRSERIASQCQPLAPTRKLTAVQQEEVVQKMFYERIARTTAAAQKLQQKYCPPPSPGHKLSDESVSDFNDRFYYKYEKQRHRAKHASTGQIKLQPVRPEPTGKPPSSAPTGLSEL